MNDSAKTVTVEDLVEQQAIRMTWQRRVTYNDVKDAFRSINQILNASLDPRYVLVDITSNPNFPLGATIGEAAAGPYRNPHLKAWLIIGSNGPAHIIEQILSSLTGRHNVLWFNSEAEAWRYLEREKTH